MQIQWFPGHMHKASLEIKHALPDIDVLIEILDARIPFSSQNPMLDKLRGDKPTIRVLNKCDLADPELTAIWQSHMEQQVGVKTLAVTTQQPDKIRQISALCARMLPEKTDVSGLDPERLIPIPSRFLRTDRDHPRLAFLDGAPWLVADTHDRNVVIDPTGAWRIIDLVAAPLPPEWLGQMRLFRDWIERARRDPQAEVLAPVDDAEL